jgi:hypothetical protein
MIYSQYPQNSSALMTLETLRQENLCYCHTGGISQNNCHAGFQSAFLDCATGRVYLSRFANGKPAPVHLLDGLPEELVLQRSAEGRITTVKETVVAGFLYDEHFYTREQAARFLAGNPC